MRALIPNDYALADVDVLRAKVKHELRKRMRGVRKTTPLAACALRSARIVIHLEALEFLLSARSVALFWPIESRHEVDLRALDASLRARGVRVAYPACASSDGERMTFCFTNASSELEDRGYGFFEPSLGAPEADTLDAIIVPALAVDPKGHRIGYGAGHYDRALPRFALAAVTVAVAYDWQLIAEVPAGPHDAPCDWVVTDARVLEAHRPEQT